MTKTKTGCTVSEKFKSLGIQWQPQEDGTPDDGGFKWRELVYGRRPFYGNVLVGSSTFCLYWCEVVKRHKLTEAVFRDYPDSELWVFKIPEPIYESIKPYLSNLTRYLCLPVSRADAFPTWNWSPILLRTPDEAERYLTGWQM